MYWRSEPNQVEIEAKAQMSTRMESMMETEPQGVSMLDINKGLIIQIHYRSHQMRTLEIRHQIQAVLRVKRTYFGKIRIS